MRARNLVGDGLACQLALFFVSVITVFGFHTLLATADFSDDFESTTPEARRQVTQKEPFAQADFVINGRTVFYVNLPKLPSTPSINIFESTSYDLCALFSSNYQALRADRVATLSPQLLAHLLRIFSQEMAIEWACQPKGPPPDAPKGRLAPAKATVQTSGKAAVQEQVRQDTRTTETTLSSDEACIAAWRETGMWWWKKWEFVCEDNQDRCRNLGDLEHYCTCAPTGGGETPSCTCLWDNVSLRVPSNAPMPCNCQEAACPPATFTIDVVGTEVDEFGRPVQVTPRQSVPVQVAGKCTFTDKPIFIPNCRCERHYRPIVAPGF